MKLRHEYKYIVSEAQLCEFGIRADAVLKKDSHVMTEGPYRGAYNIRSVYFDDMYDSCYYDNENGTDPREKFRIRIYNHSDERISLELKSKRAGKCLKTSCRLSRDECDRILRGEIPNGAAELTYPLDKLVYQMKTRGLRPVIIVEYDRTPYVYKDGNVRVTFDRNIRSSSDVKNFFEKNILMRPILPHGQHILEVKWDEFIPDHIRMALQMDDISWTSFSKFYLCRKYAPFTVL